MFDKKTILGYHVTSKKNADSIIRTKEFKPTQSDQHLLGQGSYFFFDKKVADLYTNSDYETFLDENLKNSKKVIVKTIIKCKKSNILNLDDRTTLKQFDEWLAGFLKQCEKEGKKIVINNKALQQTYFALDMYKRKFNYIVVMFTYQKSKPPYCKVTSVYSSIKYWGFQYKETYICVSDNSVINKVIICK